MLEHLVSSIKKLGHPRILVAGDVILDQYVFGDVDRVSPEAPIPVLRQVAEEHRLGGAANVAHNLHRLGARVALLGSIGADSSGRCLRRGLEAIAPGGLHLLVTRDRPTTEKTRFLSHGQQLLRVDREEPKPLSRAVERRALSLAGRALANCDAVILSDYGKGLLTPSLVAHVIATARRRKVPVFVDPKGTDWDRYRGATYLTPNRSEAEAATGRKLRTDDELSDAASRLVVDLDLEGVVVTLGSAGIFLLERGQTPRRVPALARPVYDVTGAGDTAVALFALGIVSGLPSEVAASLANLAASIVVGRVGTAAVTREELSEVAASRPREPKVLEPASLLEALDRRRRAGERIVFTNGCFDLLHAGHVAFLRFARAQGDLLVVGVNGDRSVRALKGRGRPVLSLSDRLEILASLEPIDYLVAFHERTPLAIIEKLRPDVLVKGEDWREKGVVGREAVESWGGRVVLAPLSEGRSTTRVIDRVLSMHNGRRP